MEQSLVRPPLSTCTFRPALSCSPLVKLSTRCSHHRVRCTLSGDTSSSGEYSQVGDLGARDPFAGEIATSFGDKVLGEADTEHKKLIPSMKDIVGLSSRTCGPEGNSLLSEGDASELVKRLVGWKLVPSPGATSPSDPSQPAAGLRLSAEWKLKDFQCAMELLQRVAAIAEEQKHHPDVHVEGFNRARVELWNHSAGGLTENDFILAAKIDNINVRDLILRNRFWA